MIPKTQDPGTDAVRIVCNQCRRWSYVSAPEPTDAEAIRAVARKTGWVSEGKSDLCPKCVQTMEAAS